MRALCLIKRRLTVYLRGLIVPQVRVGSLSDPKDTPGLAHFCEHMLFYASAKYPKEDAYSKFVVSFPSCISLTILPSCSNHTIRMHWLQALSMT